MSKPTYKIVRTLTMIEGEKAAAIGVVEHETVETGLTWKQAKERTLGKTSLKAVREIEAAPTTAREVEAAPLVGGYLK